MGLRARVRPTRARVRVDFCEISPVAIGSAPRVWRQSGFHLEDLFRAGPAPRAEAIEPSRETKRHRVQASPAGAPPPRSNSAPWTHQRAGCRLFPGGGANRANGVIPFRQPAHTRGRSTEHRSWGSLATFLLFALTIGRDCPSVRLGSGVGGRRVLRGMPGHGAAQRPVEQAVRVRPRVASSPPGRDA